MKQRHQSPASGQPRATSQSGSTLMETFMTELKDLYDAEKQLIKALPKMAKAADHEDLRSAFETHLSETEQHVERLEQVFELCEEKPAGKKCRGMEGLIEEARELIEEGEGDAALICAAQKAEHYEIAAYGSLASWAKLLGKTEVADILEETLGEEKETDQKLTGIAETCANVEEAEEEESAS